MNTTNILESVINLRLKLESSDNIEPEVLQQMKLLEDEVQLKMDSNELKAEESLFEQLLQLETNFAANHPTLEKLTREIIDKLSLMGV
jgi:hypothetical protein